MKLSKKSEKKYEEYIKHLEASIQPILSRHYEWKKKK